MGGGGGAGRGLCVDAAGGSWRWLVVAGGSRGKRYRRQQGRGDYLSMSCVELCCEGGGVIGGHLLFSWREAIRYWPNAMRPILCLWWGWVEAYIPPLNNVPVPARPSMSNAFSSSKRDGVGVRIDIERGILE